MGRRSLWILGVGMIAAGLALNSTSNLTPTALLGAVNACDTSVAPGQAACLVKVRTDIAGKGFRPAAVRAQNPDLGIGGGGGPNCGSGSGLGNCGGYDPAYLQSAYNLGSAAASNGTGKTVALVDAYDDPSAESDLAQYRAEFELPACTTANGCFRKVNESGQQSSYPATNSTWEVEISADVDMASAMCPRCNILLVEVNSSNLSDLGTGNNLAASMGASAISNSYGGPEWSGEAGFDSYYTHPGIMDAASSGDSQYGVEYPAASPDVTAVGGTSLHQTGNSGTRNATETVWDANGQGTGSGCSAYEPKPSWQHDSGCANRTVGDVSAEADPGTPVWYYNAGAWGWAGGTSVASPIVAAASVLAGNSSFSPSTPYSDSTSYNDVTSGSNGSCSPAYLCTAEVGYDGPTGLGTPNGVGAFSASTVQLSANPASESVNAGTAASFALTLNGSSNMTSPFTLSVAGAPSGTSFSTNPVTLSSGVGTSTLMVPATAPSGQYSMTISANDGKGHSQTTTAQLTVAGSPPPPPGNFSITATPTSQNVSVGTASSFGVSLSASNGFSNPVTLSQTGAPSGSTFSSTTPTWTSGAATSTLQIPATAAAGSYSITVTGDDGQGNRHSTAVSLNVQSFTLKDAAASVVVTKGGSVTDALTLTSLGGYSGSVQITLSGGNKKSTHTVSNTTVVPTASGVVDNLTIGALANAPVGSYTLTIKASGPGAPLQTLKIKVKVKK